MIANFNAILKVVIPLAHCTRAGALQQRVMTLTTELAAAQQGHASAVQHAAKAGQLLDEARAASEQLRADLASAQAALDHSASSEASYKAGEQAAREELQTCRRALLNFPLPTMPSLLVWPHLSYP
jgi:chromosome segregation ATPase